MNGEKEEEEEEDAVPLGATITVACANEQNHFVHQKWVGPANRREWHSPTRHTLSLVSTDIF